MTWAVARAMLLPRWPLPLGSLAHPALTLLLVAAFGGPWVPRTCIVWTVLQWELCKGWCAAQKASGSANFRSEFRLWVPLPISRTAVQTALHTRWRASVIDQDTACKNFPRSSQHEFSPLLEQGDFLDITYHCIAKEQRGKSPMQQSGVSKPSFAAANLWIFMVSISSKLQLPWDRFFVN